MVNKRDARTSRSYTRRSKMQPRSVEHQESDPLHEDNPVADSQPHIEDQMRRMVESHDQILQLLKEMRQPIPAIPLEDNHISSRSEGADHDDTENSIIPSRGANDNPSMFVGNSAQQHLVSAPDNAIRDELRRLIREEFPLVGKDRSPNQRKVQDSSPLAEAILQHLIPVGFKLPSIDSYDGTSDPYEHVDHYRTIMHIQRAPQALLCQVFPTTLKGQARTWFYSLPEGTIHTFNELAKLFVEQFIANRRIVKDSSHLSGIRQSEGESLKEYFRRFSNEARQIPGVNPELLRGVLLGGLRPGPFYSSLMRETVTSYVGLIHRIEAQITAEEAISAHKQQFEQFAGKRKNIPEDIEQNVQRKKFNRNFTPPHQSQHHEPRRERNYTPLNTSRTDIMMAIEDKDFLNWPRSLKNSNGGDQSQFCRFHRVKGHSTENCFHLKEEIERLIRQGHLGRYLRGQGEEEQKMVRVIE